MSSGFVSEAQVAENKRIRQENWENTRNEDDPLEAPEEAAFDPRSLYERLKDQKDEKQEAYDEAHKFKNMVRGLEDDEVDFLELVDSTKLREEKRVKTEESSAIAEYRKKVSEMQKKAAEEDMRAEMRAGESRKSAGVKKTSQLSLLAGAIKRKSTSEDKSQEENDAKKNKTESNATSNGNQVYSTGLHCIAVLPGLGNYTDSDDSDNPNDSDSDSEECMPVTSNIPRDITGRIIKAPAQISGGQQSQGGGGGGGGCC